VSPEFRLWHFTFNEVFVTWRDLLGGTGESVLTSPGLNVCARQVNSCYRFDLPNGQCTEIDDQGQCDSREQQSFRTLVSSPEGTLD